VDGNAIVPRRALLCLLDHASGAQFDDSPTGWQRDSNTLIRSCFVIPREAMASTKSTRSPSSNVGSQSFIRRNVIAALAPTRFLRSMQAWSWQRRNQYPAAIAGMVGCKNSPPNVACGVAIADSSAAESRIPDEPPYRSICCWWISRTSSSARKRGSTGFGELLTRRAS